jgi:hypothetical protein
LVDLLPKQCRDHAPHSVLFLPYKRESCLNFMLLRQWQPERAKNSSSRKVPHMTIQATKFSMEKSSPKACATHQLKFSTAPCQS